MVTTWRNGNQILDTTLKLNRPFKGHKLILKRESSPSLEFLELDNLKALSLRTATERNHFLTSRLSNVRNSIWPMTINLTWLTPSGKIMLQSTYFHTNHAWPRLVSTNWRLLPRRIRHTPTVTKTGLKISNKFRAKTLKVEQESYSERALKLDAQNTTQFI